MHDVWIPDYSAYPVAVTVECAPGGMADCDGWSEDMDACECPCHGNGIHPDNPVPETVGEVIAWHEQMHAEAEKARGEHERVRLPLTRCATCHERVVLANGLGNAPEEYVHADMLAVTDGHEVTL